MSKPQGVAHDELNQEDEDKMKNLN